MPQRDRVSRLVLGLAGLALIAAPALQAQGVSVPRGGGLTDLKGHAILEAGMLAARVAKGFPSHALEGETREWYELLLPPAQPRLCLTFLSARSRLTDPRPALLLLDAQHVRKVALLRDTVGGMTAEVIPIQLVQCPP